MDLGYNTVVFNNKKIGFLICEDIWYDGYYSSPYQNLMKKKPDIVISINASPYVQGKLKTRINKVKEIMRKCKDLHVPEYFVYVNSVGSHDGYDGEVVFDGGSFIVDKNRDVVSFCEEFVETTVLFDTEDYNKKSFKIDSSKDIEKTIRAIEIGIKSYFDRFNMKKAIIGLSGGIDSAVTAALSAASLGSENVIGVSMPSHYSSDGSITDAKDLAKNLGIDYINIPIKEVVYSYGDILSKTINPFYETITEENIQARIRGNILMALSNSIPGSMVLSTGNKTELALGYCTPYGDMAGGLSPLADVDKTNVYLIAEKINRKREIIPVNTITKPPSAELAPNQTDEKGLGFSYDILVDAVNYVIEKGIFQKEKLEEYLLKFEGIDAKKMSDMVMDRIVKNEWKRRQAAPGIKVTLKAFGSGRRVPLLY
jgi:NAD+ synthase (glutamine-hydrolysing)